MTSYRSSTQGEASNGDKLYDNYQRDANSYKEINASTKSRQSDSSGFKSLCWLSFFLSKYLSKCIMILLLK